MPSRFVPEKTGHGEYSEKHSRFLATVCRVTSEEEVSAVIAALRKEHFEARHVVHAFLLADGTARFSDDGEPHGTAGKPLMNLLTGSGLTDCLVTVVRYFGGTLLGTGGLVRAYSEAARLAFADAGREEKRELVQGELTCAYDLYENINRLLTAFEASEVTPTFAEEVKLSFFLPTEQQAPFARELAERFTGKEAKFTETTEKIV